MRSAPRVLQRASPAVSVVEDGQDSMRKLAFAPLGFLSLGGGAFHIASILASAVSFLEGYSAEDLEADVRLVRDSRGAYVAHTELKLVPYALTRQTTPTEIAPRHLDEEAAESAMPKLAHQFSLSRVLCAQEPDIQHSSELERFQNSFLGSGMTADFVANDILRTTNSADVADAVLRYSAQVGLTIPSSTLEELMTRIANRENSLAHTAFSQFEFEMNFSAVREPTLMAPHPSVSELLLPRKRKQSKLERLRSSAARSFKP